MNQNKNHLRQNLLTGQWVIYAPDRAQRPGHHDQVHRETDLPLPEKDPQCPFCPGNETMLPDVLMEMQNDTGSWATRVVSNKYPAVTTDQAISTASDSLGLTAAAYGRHEVIIETPYHNQDIPTMSDEQCRRILETYAHRRQVLFEEFPAIQSVIIFRNHGPGSGTSLVHPHSQLIATAVVPAYLQQQQANAARYYEKHRCCPVCDLIENEKQCGDRVIVENDAFTAWVPFAAEVPYEVWIVPRRHQSDFRPDTDQIAPMADVLTGVLSAYRDHLSNPDYNFILHSSARDRRNSPAQHCFLQVRPRVTIPAGFEIGSGMHINPSLPEADAKLLRDAIRSQV